jgi:Protein of unknown function (DUF3501)
MTTVTSHELTIDDIADLRAYERERQEFRAKVIALKKPRRVHLGTIQTLVFENRDTIRFQIQEMARVEKIFTDEGILHELATYNPLISRPGKLSATLFIELTSDEQLREWLPKLAGVERCFELHVGEGEDLEIIPARDEMTASVHYLWWPLDAAQTDKLAAGPASVVCTHPAYLEQADLADSTRASLVADLR